MKEHGISNPWNLTEFDQWVNDATRKDINDAVELNNGQVFGLKIWTWREIEAEHLKEVCRIDPPAFLSHRFQYNCYDM